jgi:transcriptional regulator with XRE-family HTH domain
MNLMQLAQRIRDFRTRRNMTLEQLAESSGLTGSFLSRVENFRTTPSLPALGRIAAGLGVSVSELVKDLDEKPRVVIVRRNERKQVERDRPDSRIVYYALAHKRSSKAMEPFLLEVPPGLARSERLTHEQDEFIMVLEGELDCEYGDEQFRLQQGDCFYAEGGIKHTINNPNQKPAQVLMVYAMSSISKGEEQVT